MRKITDPVARFWSKVDKSAGVDGCWLWTGPTRTSGYGHFTVRRESFQAHRFAYDSVHSEAPLGSLLACHTCDTPLCCNPAHIFPGTSKDNMRDAMAKGRFAFGDRNGSRKYAMFRPRGEEHPAAKVNAEQVRQIRMRRADGESLGSLASAFGISRKTILLMVRRETWAHVA